jgi:hypothetical protein
MSQPRLTGAIHLHRITMDSWAWQCPPPKFKVFIQLLLTASDIDEEKLLHDKFVHVKRGEVVDFLPDLAKNIGMSVQSYKDALEFLVDKEFCTVEKDGRRTKIFILNYDKYQQPCMRIIKGGISDTSEISTVVSESEDSDQEPTISESVKDTSPKIGTLASLDKAKLHAGSMILRIGTKESPGVRTRQLISEGKRINVALMIAAQECWNDANDVAWIGLFDILFEKIFGYRSAEILVMNKKTLSTYYPRIRTMLKVLEEWYPGKSKLYFYSYMKWLFKKEEEKTQWVVENNKSMNRNPLLLEQAFDINKLSKWRASKEVSNDVQSGRRTRQLA